MATIALKNAPRQVYQVGIFVPSWDVAVFPTWYNLVSGDPNLPCGKLGFEIRHYINPVKARVARIHHTFVCAKSVHIASSHDDGPDTCPMRIEVN